MFETEALLLVLPTTEYQKRVPVTIGTSLTDMDVDSLGTFRPVLIINIMENSVLYHSV